MVSLIYGGFHTNRTFLLLTSGLLVQSAPTVKQVKARRPLFSLPLEYQQGFDHKGQRNSMM